MLTPVINRRSLMRLSVIVTALTIAPSAVLAQKSPSAMTSPPVAASTTRPDEAGHNDGKGKDAGHNGGKGKNAGHNGAKGKNAGHNGGKGKNAGHNGVDAAEDRLLPKHKPAPAASPAQSAPQVSVAGPDRDKGKDAGHHGGKGKNAGHNGVDAAQDRELGHK